MRRLGSDQRKATRGLLIETVSAAPKECQQSMVWPCVEEVFQSGDLRFCINVSGRRHRKSRIALDIGRRGLPTIIYALRRMSDPPGVRSAKGRIALESGLPAGLSCRFGELQLIDCPASAPLRRIWWAPVLIGLSTVTMRLECPSRFPRVQCLDRWR